VARSNKPIVWSLFAAGGTLAAFLAPALAALLLLAALGRVPAALEYEALRAFAAGLPGRVVLFVVIALFLWHAAHRLRITLYDLGMRRDRWVALVVYLLAGTGTLAAAVVLGRIA
jgi:fumarate reductase subunit D